MARNNGGHVSDWLAEPLTELPWWIGANNKIEKDRNGDRPAQSGGGITLQPGKNGGFKWPAGKNMK